MGASHLNNFYLNRKLTLNALNHVGFEMTSLRTTRGLEFLDEVLKLIRSSVSSRALFGRLLRPRARMFSPHTKSNISCKVEASLQNIIPLRIQL